MLSPTESVMYENKTKQNTGNCKTTAHDAHSYSWTSTSTRRQADARILTPTGRKAQ